MKTHYSLFLLLGAILQGNIGMAYTQIRLPEIKIIGIQVRTTNENMQCLQDMSALWARFFTENMIEKIPGIIDEHAFGVYTDYEKDATAPYSYTVGCHVDSLDKIPEGMVGITIPEQFYAQFSATPEAGSDLKTAVGKAWGQIWQTPLDRAYAVDFEFYPHCFENYLFDKAEVYISIK